MGGGGLIGSWTFTSLHWCAIHCRLSFCRSFGDVRDHWCSACMSINTPPLKPSCRVVTAVKALIQVYKPPEQSRFRWCRRHISPSPCFPVVVHLTIEAPYEALESARRVMCVCPRRWSWLPTHSFRLARALKDPPAAFFTLRPPWTGSCSKTTGPGRLKHFNV